MYVLLYHTALIPTPALAVPKWAAPVVLNGGMGVTLFFIASAFSLCHSARPGEDRHKAYAAFVLRRLFRIAPLFYIVLAISIARDEWLFGVWHGIWPVIANFGFGFNFWAGRESGIVWASWTIGVEMPFYVIFPFLLARTRTEVSAASFVLVFLLLSIVWPGLAFLRWAGAPDYALSSQGNFGIVRYLPIFAGGILVYRLYDRFIKGTPPSPAAGWVLLLSALYLHASLISGRLGVGVFSDAYYWQMIIFGLLILSISIHPNAFVVNRLTSYCGKISYSIYLLHPLVIYFLIPVFRSIENLGWPNTISFGLCAALTLGITAAAATVTYQLVELPGMALGRHLIRRAGLARTVPQVA